MTKTTEDFKNSVLALYQMEGKTLDPILLNLIGNNFDHFCSIEIEAAEKAKVEEVLKLTRTVELEASPGCTACRFTAGAIGRFCKQVEALLPPNKPGA